MIKRSILLILLSFFLFSCDTEQSVELPIENAGEQNVSQENNQAESGIGDQPNTALDLTGETFTIYHLGNLTGINAELVIPMIRGVEDMVDAVNQEGGIYGAELQEFFFDTQGDPELTLRYFEQILLQVPFLVIVYDWEDEAIVAPLAAEAQVPVLGLGINHHALYAQEDGYLFGIGVPYPDQFAHFLTYVSQHWEEIRRDGMGDSINLATLSWGNQIGQSALTDETRALAEELGINIVAELSYEDSYTESLSNQILQIRNAGGNLIYTNTYAFGPALVENSLNQLGLQLVFVVGGPYQALDTFTYAYLEYNPYMNGFIAPYFTAWWGDQDHPGIQFAEENFDEYDRTLADQSQGRLLALGAVSLARDVLMQAILEVGESELDGQALYDVLITLEDYSVLDGLFSVTYTDGHRSGDWLHMRVEDDFMVFRTLQSPLRVNRVVP